MENILEIHSLSKNYNHFKALDSCSMTIQKGAIYGFIGKNGSGKTTLIRIICGLQNQSSGDIKLFNIDNKSKNFSESKKRISAIVETPAIYLEMSAHDNIKYQYYLQGIPTMDGIDELLRMVGLENCGKKKAKFFSLGMKQRLGIAISLVNNPDFIILDEPTNGLDPQGIIEVRELILKLNRELNITFLISSHLLDELSRIATHYGFIDRGHIIKEISSTDLFNEYGKFIIINVSDTTVLSCVLEKLNCEYKIIDHQIAHIYTKVKISLLAKELEKLGCEIVSVHEIEETLESYYINLVGGNIHA
ncbi:ABC transporter ATP-binding protein [Anaerorhabdus sp.]|uniref:ABC transporter ATP-binding protein n=1 Tax=Anaerorhabdus sp. TaxID=1872524 RepID=UPI002FC637E9